MIELQAKVKMSVNKCDYLISYKVKNFANCGAIVLITSSNLKSVVPIFQVRWYLLQQENVQSLDYFYMPKMLKRYEIYTKMYI